MATIASGFTGVMGLELEAETGHLWAVCDDTCNGRSATLDIAQTGVNAGKFVVTNVYARPTAMPNINNEGFAITPQEECVEGRKPVFWSDDNNTDMHALRVGSLNCTVLIKPQTITFAQPAAIAFGSAPGRLLDERAARELHRDRAVRGDRNCGGPDVDEHGRGTLHGDGKPGRQRRVRAGDARRADGHDRQAPTRLRQRPVSLLGSAFSLRVTRTARS